MKMQNVKNFFIISLILFGCNNPESLKNKADGTINGNVLAGTAATQRGTIFIAASRYTLPNEIDWNSHTIQQNSFGDYEISELVEGNYYIAMYMDVNGNEIPDAGDPWGGYDTNGDDRLDQVKLLGGKTLTVDIRFFTKL